MKPTQQKEICKCIHGKEIGKTCVDCGEICLALNPVCGCNTKYCKHYESDFDRYVKETSSPTVSTEEKWEKEFDNAFNSCGYDHVDTGIEGGGRNKLKDIVRRLIASQRKAIEGEERKKVEGIIEQMETALEEDMMEARKQSMPYYTKGVSTLEHIKRIFTGLNEK